MVCLRLRARGRGRRGLCAEPPAVSPGDDRAGAQLTRRKCNHSPGLCICQDVGGPDSPGPLLITIEETRDMTHGWLQRLRSGSVGLAFLAGLLVAGVLHLPHLSSAQQPASSTVASAKPSPAGTTALSDLSEAFASVAEHVKPSVVFIKSGHTEQRPRMQLQVPPGFEQFFPRMPQGPQGPDFEESAGSGFIVSKD